jgi:hypothetical protein
MPRVNGATRGKVGPWSPNQVQQIADTVAKVREARNSTPPSPSSSARFFLARITGSNARGGKTKVWLYDWEEVFVDNSHNYLTSVTVRRQSSQDATYGKALNGNEGMQTIAAGTPTVYGPGVTASTIPTGMSYNAVGNDTVVLMYALSRNTGAPLYWFYAVNPINGTCS